MLLHYFFLELCSQAVISIQIALLTSVEDYEINGWWIVPGWSIP
jgi:hypothetical protein